MGNCEDSNHKQLYHDIVLSIANISAGTKTLKGDK